MKLKYTVEEFNKIANSHHDLASKLRNGIIMLICSICKCDLEESRHIDDSKYPFKRQMLCVNSKCNQIYYRIE